MACHRADRPDREPSEEPAVRPPRAGPCSVEQPTEAELVQPERDRSRADSSEAQPAFPAMAPEALFLESLADRSAQTHLRHLEPSDPGTDRRPHGPEPIEPLAEHLVAATAARHWFGSPANPHGARFGCAISMASHRGWIPSMSAAGNSAADSEPTTSPSLPHGRVMTTSPERSPLVEKKQEVMLRGQAAVVHRSPGRSGKRSRRSWTIDATQENQLPSPEEISGL